MELLTRNNFEDWMQKLMERLDRQDELLLSLRPSGKAPNPMESIRMFDAVHGFARRFLFCWLPSWGKLSAALTAD